MEFSTDYIIRPLQPSDITTNFKTGSQEFQPLKTFLRNQAKEFQIAMIAQTYVCILLENGQDKGKVIAYLTLTCSELDLRNGYEVKDCAYANKYDHLPAVKIARLAVDNRYRGRGLGSELVNLALDIALNDIYPTVGCRFLITDAKKSAVDFYQKERFTLLDTEENQANENPIMFIDLYSAINQ